MVRSRNNTSLLLQIVLCLIIFVFGYSICMRVLTEAEVMKTDSQDIYKAVYVSQNITERYLAGENAELSFFDKAWNEVENISSASFSIIISDDILTAQRVKDSKILCSWEVVR